MLQYLHQIGSAAGDDRGQKILLQHAEELLENALDPEKPSSLKRTACVCKALDLGHYSWASTAVRSSYL